MKFEYKLKNGKVGTITAKNIDDAISALNRVDSIVPIKKEPTIINQLNKLIFENIDQLQKHHNITDKNIEVMCKITHRTLRNWKTGKCSPNKKNVLLLLEMFKIDEYIRFEAGRNIGFLLY